MVSYNDKHNEANGEDNRDGSSDNRSWNCGTEGPTDDPAIDALRDRQVRNMLATLLLAQGTPMLQAGDEFRRTQGGNNNAYCQDDAIAWVDWSLREKHAGLVAFVTRLTGLRREYGILRRSRFLTGAYDEELEVKDVTWLDAAANEIAPDAWGDMRCFGMLIDGRARSTGIRRQGGDATLLLIFNSYHEDVDVTVPHTAGSDAWSLLIDTALPQTGGDETLRSGDIRHVTARSFVVLGLTRTTG